MLTNSLQHPALNDARLRMLSERYDKYLPDYSVLNVDDDPTTLAESLSDDHVEQSELAELIAAVKPAI